MLYILISVSLCNILYILLYNIIIHYISINIRLITHNIKTFHSLIINLYFIQNYNYITHSIINVKRVYLFIYCMYKNYIRLDYYYTLYLFYLYYSNINMTIHIALLKKRKINHSIFMNLYFPIKLF